MKCQSAEGRVWNEMEVFSCICIYEFCKEWKVKINAEKRETVVFQMGGKLSKNEKWGLGTEEVEVTYKIKYGQ
jgi:hypothetical protein